MSAYEWVKLGWTVMSGLLAFAMQLAWFYIVYRAFRYFVYERPGIVRGGTPQPFVLMRRLWCRHRVLARGRDPYGKQTVLCAACGHDVNAGKPREQWR